MTNDQWRRFYFPHWSLVIGHWSFKHSLRAQLGTPLGPGLHSGLLWLGLALALGGAGKLLRALFAADALVVDLGPALGTTPVLDLQDKLRSGTHANHVSAAFLLEYRGANTASWPFSKGKALILAI